MQLIIASDKVHINAISYHRQPAKPASQLTNALLLVNGYVRVKLQRQTDRHTERQAGRQLLLAAALHIKMKRRKHREIKPHFQRNFVTHAEKFSVVAIFSTHGIDRETDICTYISSYTKYSFIIL